MSNCLNKLFLLGQQTISGGANSGEIFEFDKQPVCEYWFCLSSDNYIYVIIFIILLIVLAFLLYFLYKDTH